MCFDFERATDFRIGDGEHTSTTVYFIIMSRGHFKELDDK